MKTQDRPNTIDFIHSGPGAFAIKNAATFPEGGTWDNKIRKTMKEKYCLSNDKYDRMTWLIWNRKTVSKEQYFETEAAMMHWNLLQVRKMSIISP